MLKLVHQLLCYFLTFAISLSFTWSWKQQVMVWNVCVFSIKSLLISIMYVRPSLFFFSVFLHNCFKERCLEISYFFNVNPFASRKLRMCKSFKLTYFYKGVIKENTKKYFHQKLILNCRSTKINSANAILFDC